MNRFLKCEKCFPFWSNAVCDLVMKWHNNYSNWWYFQTWVYVKRLSPQTRCHTTGASADLTKMLDSCIWFIAAPVGAYKNCESRPYFRSTPRGIGYSFQLAITAPRLNLIGYGTATAQSWPILGHWDISAKFTSDILVGESPTCGKTSFDSEYFTEDNKT